MADHDTHDHTGVPGVGTGTTTTTVATDAIFDAKGDLPVGTGANTAAKLTAGANDTILMAESGESTGLKWVASQTPSTQAFGDAAAEGTADTYARGDHKHAMPASPSAGTLIGLTAYRKASDAALGATTSATSVDVDATNLQVVFTAPASTNVLVRFTCYMVNTGNNNDYWQVRESTTVLAEELICANETAGKRFSAAMLIAGISAGSHTYKWGFKTSGGTVTLYGGPTFGEAVLEVWAAP